MVCLNVLEFKASAGSAGGVEKASAVLAMGLGEVVINAEGSPGAGWQLWGRRGSRELWGGQC